LVRASRRDGAGPKENSLNSDQTQCGGRCPYGEAVQSNRFYRDFPVTLASRTLRTRQVAHLYNNLSVGACFDRCGLTEGRRRIHGYSNNELAFYPEGSRRAHAFINLRQLCTINRNQPKTGLRVLKIGTIRTRLANLIVAADPDLMVRWCAATPLPPLLAAVEQELRQLGELSDGAFPGARLERWKERVA
jgi:hypothetical protein